MPGRSSVLLHAVLLAGSVAAILLVTASAVPKTAVTGSTRMAAGVSMELPAPTSESPSIRPKDESRVPIRN